MKNLYIKAALSAMFIIFMGSVAYSQKNYERSATPVFNSNPDPSAIQQIIDDYQPRVVRSNIEMPEGWDIKMFTGNQREQIDNKGTDFWLMFPRNYTTLVDGIYLDITSEFSTSGTVMIPGLSFTENFNVSPNSITRITLPGDVQITATQGIEQKGIHVVANDDVAIYGISLKAFSSDSYLALPVDILSTQYMVMSYPNLQTTSPTYELISELGIVSPYDNVTVTITPSCQTYGGSPAGVPYQITLNQGDVYQVQSIANNDYQYDLTGTVIQSSLPVAVVGANACACIPQNVAACDHVLEQLPPVSTWGNQFIAYPLEGRENGDTWRMLAASDNTELYIDGSLVETLNFGDFYETILTNSADISASNPIIVMQYSNGDDWDPNLPNNGDPFMMLIPPTEQFMDQYTFATPSEGYVYNYVTVTIETDAIGTLVLDGATVDPGLFTPIGTTGYSGAGIPIDAGSHTIQNTAGVPFGIYSYGFAEYDSYGYAGGLSLEFIYEGSAPVIVRTAQTISLENSGQPENQALTIEAEITDPEAPFTQSAILYYKHQGAGTYDQVNMTEGANNIWSAQIPAGTVMDPGVHYYIYATDGQLASSNPAIDPVNNPYGIAVLPNVLPVIVHNDITSAPFDQDLSILADVTDNTNLVASVTLFYRNKGGNPVYNSAAMNLQNNDTYEGVIPANFITQQGTEYYIKATDDFGMSTTHKTANNPVVLNGSTDIDENNQLALSNIRIFPNPVQGIASVKVEIKERSEVSLILFNSIGEEIKIWLDRENLSPGIYQYTIDGNKIPAGFYMFELSINDRSEMVKMVVSQK